MERGSRATGPGADDGGRATSETGLALVTPGQVAFGDRRARETSARAVSALLATAPQYVEPPPRTGPGPRRQDPGRRSLNPAPAPVDLSRTNLLREMPFLTRRRSLFAAALSLLAMSLLAAYLLVPNLTLACGTDCRPAPALSFAYEVLTFLTLAINAYFVALYLTGLAASRRARWRYSKRVERPFFVIVTPAHNEAVVIGETVRRLLSLDYVQYLSLIMNDGSKDDTSAIALAAAGGDPRLIVVDRPPEIAGQGKGEVLNHAYAVIVDMVERDDPRLLGTRPEDIILCVLDADGWLKPNALRAVAPLFDDEKVAGVQVPVRMYNARNGFLAMMQDIEFIGFSLLIQGGRNVLGSALLGGNGQFVRLEALRSIGPAPWTRSLTEDLDLGLRLVKAGWTNRVCTLTCVAQQAVTSPRKLIRQRTRWVQGHYSCWSHLPGLWRSRDIPLSARVDLSLHLLLATTILVVTAQAIFGLLGFLGVLPIGVPITAKLFPSDLAVRIAVIVMVIGPLGLLALAYQHSAVAYQGARRFRLPLWAVPGMLLTFTAYTYLWGIPSSAAAFVRMARGRDSWAKTDRDPLTLQAAPAVEESPAPQLARGPASR